MNIYHVTRNDGHGRYDTYSDFVVIAHSEEDARKCHPDNAHSWARQKIVTDEEETYDSWVKYSETTAKFIGKADDNYEGSPVICASFHAG